jgi:very long chain acyl-CoA dehydrogenase
MRDTGLEKVMRDLRIFRIFEGTNDILRLFVALVGIQYAGGHLKELQKAVMDPISNFGVVMGEVSKRGKAVIGIGAGNMLADSVHPNLVDSAELTSKSIEAFGGAVEKLLIKYGKHIIHEQFLLKRLADSTIDIYGMTCALSRCSKSLSEGLPSAHHEQMMTNVWCSEAYTRTKANLAMLQDPVAIDNFKTMAEISKNVCSRVSPVQANPIGV